MKSRLWLELAWVPWQKTLDVKMSLDATKLFFKSLGRPTPKKTSKVCITVSLFAGHFQNWFVNCDIWTTFFGEWSSHIWLLAPGCLTSGSWQECGMLSSWQLRGYTLPQHSICRYDGVLVTPHGCLMRILFIEWQEVALCIPKAVPKPLPSRRASVCRET